jgi:predicted nucleic acid-binding protein
MIILDTNVLSEVIRPKPAVNVVDWLARQISTQLFITTITEAEVLYGIALLASGRRRLALDAAARLAFDEDFAGRVLPFDSAAATEFASIAVARRAIGRPIGHFDAQIAAIARSRGASVATRDAADFADCGISVINPWSQ